MLLDLSKLSPIARIRVLDALNTAVCRELRNIQDAVARWTSDGHIDTPMGKELVAWKDALVDLRVAVAAERAK